MSDEKAEFDRLVDATRRFVEAEWPERFSEEIVVALGHYLSLAKTWGARIDLTAARSGDEFLDLCLADAIVMARAEVERKGDARSFVDVGSGGGAPGLPLYLLLNDHQLLATGSLVEPRSKRVAFLRTVVGRLGLTRVDVRRCRSEAVGDQEFDVALARATLPPARWIGEGARLAKRAVWVLLAQEEPPELAGWRIDHDETYAWPLTGASRRAVRYVPGQF